VYIQNLVPRIIAASAEHEFVLVKHADQSVPSDNVEVIEVPAVGSVAELIWVQTALPRILRRKRIDVYHALKHLGPIRLDCPSIISLHEVGQYLEERTLPLVEHWYWRYLQPLSLRCADFVIVNSEWTKGIATDHLGLPTAKVNVVPLGVDPVFRVDRGPGANASGRGRLGLSERYVLAVGNINPKKNFETIVDALAQLRSTGFTIPDLVIAGGEGYRAAHFWSRVDSHGLRNRVRSLGFVQVETLRDLYDGAEALIYPSLYEAFGLPPIEAMSCGCPVITTRRGAIPDVTGGFAWFMASPTDAASLADLIAEVMRDRAAIEPRLLEAKEWCRRYSWHSAAQRTLEVYQRARRTTRSC